MIAIAGVATQTVIVVVVYLVQALRDAHAEGKLGTAQALPAAVAEGVVRAVRAMVMTVATTVLCLLPLLGADLSARTAAPVLGGMVAGLFLTLQAIPAAYTMRRHHQ